MYFLFLIVCSLQSVNHINDGRVQIQTKQENNSNSGPSGSTSLEALLAGGAHMPSNTTSNAANAKLLEKLTAQSVMLNPTSKVSCFLKSIEFCDRSFVD